MGNRATKGGQEMKTVREFERIEENALLEIAKVVPERMASALHELLIRADTSKERQKKATTAIDYNDEKAIQQRLFAVIGEICFTDFSQMDIQSRTDWSWKTMTARERKAMINALVNVCVEEEE
jgi:hypothetical protein